MGSYADLHKNPLNHLYGQGRWRKVRRAQLLREPLCAFCLQRGKVTPATTVDHVVPHKGDIEAFFHGALQSLCMSHHNLTKQQDEAVGYARDIGVDGYPLDPRHPAYVRK